MLADGLGGLLDLLRLLHDCFFQNLCQRRPKERGLIVVPINDRRRSGVDEPELSDVRPKQGVWRKVVDDAALERRFQPVLVKEPTVEDTIAILRGLKERYEVHHRVRIKDSAIVAAATLSHRYITDRFLPDKAVDLIDEAASRLKIELDSKPSEIDAIDRKIIQLEIEKQSLKKETDKTAKERRDKIEKELAELKSSVDQMKVHWSTEKDIINKIQNTKKSD